MFKYLVTMNDPQKWYSIVVLTVNFLCFMLISISYIVIHSRTARSSRSLGATKNKELARRNSKLQAKVSAIIFTDFLCWIPFTMVCFLHFGGAVDATRWYPFFSNIILPINSVINPLLYDSSITPFFLRPVRSTFRSVSKLSIGMRQTTLEAVASQVSTTQPQSTQEIVSKWKNNKKRSET